MFGSPVQHAVEAKRKPKPGVVACWVMYRNKGRVSPIFVSSPTEYTLLNDLSISFASFLCSDKPLAQPHIRYPRNMPSSKFTEILDPDFQSTSPKADARLEDLIAATKASGRGRTPSETSSQSESSSGSRTHSGDRIDEKPRRLSRLLSIAKR